MSFLQAILELVHQDPGDRGLARQEVNLLTETAGHYEQACNSLSHPGGVVLLTGFFIPTAEPPGPETDGPPGAIHLARVLTRLGFKVAIAAESYCHDALRAGLEYWGLLEQVPLLVAPLQPADQFTQDFWHLATKAVGEVTHWISIERAGPSHTVDTLREQPQFESQDLEHFLAITKPGKRGRILTMSGHDITEQTSPLHLLFEKSFSQDHGITRIGIGDGGNEIGMGAIPWQVIQQNIQNGGEIACAIPADFLLVAGGEQLGRLGPVGLAASPAPYCPR